MIKRVFIDFSQNKYKTYDYIYLVATNLLHISYAINVNVFVRISNLLPFCKHVKIYNDLIFDIKKLYFQNCSSSFYCNFDMEMNPLDVQKCEISLRLAEKQASTVR